MLLIYDTETTGLPVDGLSQDHPNQPHLLQLAARLVDPQTRRCRGEVSLISRPDGWLIPPDVEKLTGIDTVTAMEVGVPEALIARIIGGLVGVATLRIAHNDEFDDKIVRTCLLRHNGLVTEEAWRLLRVYCTKDHAAPLCALPPTERMIRAGRGHQFKSPKLIEAHEFLLGRGFDGAHDALADVRACEAVYWRLREIEAEAAS